MSKMNEPIVATQVNFERDVTRRGGGDQVP
jgi:hypothetical protein